MAKDKKLPDAPIMPEKAKKIRKYRSTRNDKTELPKQVRDFIAAQESGSMPDDAIAPKEKGATLQELYDQGVIKGKRPKNMETGGEAVPAKFKGFSKLPEKVQQKMDPNLAQKYEKGGAVGSCRGMGAALRGGKFSGVK